VRKQQALTLLAEGDLNTGEDFYAFAFIFQHGETAETTSSYMYSPWMPHAPSENAPSGRFMGRTEQPYDDAFLTDSLRTNSCIASRDQ